jgi:hypothetical protein
MRTRTDFLVTSFVLRMLMWFGILAMLVSVPMGYEDGPMPTDQLVRMKRLATIVLFTGGGVAALAAVGRFAIDRPRPGPLEKETRR